MTPQKQLFRHNPPETYGDCHRTCIACLLDVKPEAVPHFAEQYWDNVDAWDRAELSFLAHLNLSRISTPFNAENGIETILAHLGHINPNAYYILTGKSHNQTHHCVIGLGGSIVWDPSLDDSGIVGSCDDNMYWIDYFVPLSMVKIV